MRATGILRCAPLVVSGLGVVLLLTAQRHFTYCASHAVTTLVHTQPSPAFASAPPPSPPAPCARRRASRYVLQRERLPLGLPGSSGEPLHLTFATASVDELLTNWVAHVRRLRLPAVVAAMDTTVVGRCGGLRIHCLPCLDEAAEALLAAEAAKHGQRDATQVNIRGNPTLFISLGARKVGALLLLLTVSGRPVLCSDVDVVWMRDPSPLVAGKMKGFEDLAHADVLASSDCLSPALDEKDHGCFHVLQDRNTGVLLVRNTTNARATMLEWKARTAGAFEAWETDQTAFDDLVRGRGRGHRRNMTGAQRTAFFAEKKQWCGIAPKTPEVNSMGQLANLDGMHTEGSRRLFDVCIPHVARALRFGRTGLSLRDQTRRFARPHPELYIIQSAPVDEHA